VDLQQLQNEMLIFQLIYHKSVDVLVSVMPFEPMIFALGIVFNMFYIPVPFAESS
jgi:hypothetical protein